MKKWNWNPKNWENWHERNCHKSQNKKDKAKELDKIGIRIENEKWSNKKEQNQERKGGEEIFSRKWRKIRMKMKFLKKMQRI